MDKVDDVEQTDELSEGTCCEEEPGSNPDSNPKTNVAADAVDVDPDPVPNSNPSRPNN